MCLELLLQVLVVCQVLYHPGLSLLKATGFIATMKADARMQLVAFCPNVVARSEHFAGGACGGWPRHAQHGCGYPAAVLAAVTRECEARRQSEAIWLRETDAF